MDCKKLLALLLFLIPLATRAQYVIKIHHTYSGVDWSIPLLTEKTDSMNFDTETMWGHYTNKDSLVIIVPYSLEAVDSISFTPALTDDEKGYDKYKVFALYIDTENWQEVKDRDTWITCHISLDGKGEYSDYSGTGRIRGRGNSSWEWYDKKPYKFKLDEKSKLIGLDKAKDWNLLANYRDPTDLMNTVAFETARFMGMPHTNHTRYVELFLNGDYVGLYQLTEKIEVDDNRVDIDRDDGVLLSLDLDDGPSLSPNDGDNFWSQVYQLPVCVKYPDEPTQQQLNQIKSDFAELENAIQAMNYERAAELMDMPSFISILQLHEYLYNVEIDAPRSLYLYRDAGGKYTFGPVWDWDAAFDFDWSNMYTGHNYFADYKELIYGTDPYNYRGAAYHISGFFINMFGNKTFVAQYKKAWEAVKDSIYEKPWAESELYYDNLRQGAYDRDSDRWPINKNVISEHHLMSAWLKDRLRYLNTIIPDYPDGN